MHQIPADSEAKCNPPSRGSLGEGKRGARAPQPSRPVHTLESWFALSLRRCMAPSGRVWFSRCARSFPPSCFPGFLFLVLLFSKMSISRAAAVLRSFLPAFLPFALFLCFSLETGLVAWLPSAAFFLWGWDQMASNRSSWSPWLPGWQSTWERHILQPGAVRPSPGGGCGIKALPSYSYIYIFLRCGKTQILFVLHSYLVAWGQEMWTLFYPKKKSKVLFLTSESTSSPPPLHTQTIIPFFSPFPFQCLVINLVILMSYSSSNKSQSSSKTDNEHP